MNIPYTEHDAVVRESETERLLDYYSSLSADGDDPIMRASLARLLVESRDRGTPIQVPGKELVVGWDPRFESFYLVIRNHYNPENLMSVLYELLVRFDEEGLESDMNHCKDLIERYIGVVEAREKVALKEVKERLVELTGKMKETVYLCAEERFSEDDIERLSEALDRAYYEPLTEILEGVLVAIAGN